MADLSHGLAGASWLEGFEQGYEEAQAQVQAEGQARDEIAVDLARQYPEASAPVIGRVADEIAYGGALTPGNDERIIGEAEADRILRDAAAAGLSQEEAGQLLQGAVTDMLVLRYAVEEMAEQRAAEVAELETSYALFEADEPQLEL